ncbi:MAG: methylenetetrahydrofolate--tRNA-(uracil(54)-C(5))-methyltransferase (FADH(2)-oxidizing) TrmFO [Oscillospiraceae bacterium]|nr:methylenetetrahydrofolate--tRNA-(uracil(54)-C(5))-methyltransferase (FADH(2)-oxidizing) TrmFO [Oscillospiraceae bacterium]
MAVKVIGAGLAGSEAAWQLANAGIETELYEMKPVKYSPAHHYEGMAELVCSNSLKAARVDSACGLLKEEMRRLGSLIVPCAEATSVEAGGALAVDRTKFSDLVTQKIKEHPHIKVISEEVTSVPEGDVIIATGPLTSGALAESVSEKCGSYLSFFDAAAPIVTFDSLDTDIVFFASRYDKGDADYINCPMTKEEYEVFYNALINAEQAPLKEFDRESFKVYEGCMPVEVLAKRGPDTMRFGPLKPVGLTDKRTGKRPYAVVQLRKENREGTMYNLVGFQTNLKFGEQKRVFSLIPGLKDAEFVRYGVMHRNSFINSPKLLKPTFEMRECPGLYFAGQITGVEGYVESAASGIMAGLNLARKLAGKSEFVMPRETMTGALSLYISDSFNEGNFQPMGSNMGILPELPERIKDKKKKYQMYADRALEKMEELLSSER